MKKSIPFYLIIFIAVLGILSVSSCKRSAIQEPNMSGPAGFRIILSGTANPSTLYVPMTDPAVASTIIVTALNNDGSPVTNKSVIFQEGGWGYFDNYQISAVKTTNANGVAQITYYIGPGANIRATVNTYITVTLVDDGRLDSSLAQITDTIPIKIVPYLQQGLLLHGHVMTPAGTGVSEVAVELVGTDGHASGLVVTRSSGSYEFYVVSGWYGTITPTAPGYTFTPSSIEFTDLNPVTTDLDGLDFVAYFASGNTLAADLATWEVPFAGGTQLVNAYNSTGDSSIGYMVIPDSSWIMVSPSSGSTPGSFTITIEENTTGEDRSGSIAITATDTQGTDVSIAINQKGTDVSGDATLAVDRQTVDVDGDGLAQADARLVKVYNSTTDESIDYIITVPDQYADWIFITSTEGSTDGEFGIYVAANTDVARTGTVVVTATSTGVTNSTLTITVNQEAGPSIAVSPETINASAGGGETFTVTVTNPTSSDVVTWTISKSEAWLGVLPVSGYTGASFVVTIQGPNPNSAVRIGTIAVTASNGATATITIYQNGS